MEYYSAMKKEWTLAICNNMDGTREYYAKWDKSNRERQIPYDFIYMWYLKNKTNKQTKNRLFNTEKKLVVARGEVAGECVE